MRLRAVNLDAPAKIQHGGVSSDCSRLKKGNFLYFKIFYFHYFSYFASSNVSVTIRKSTNSQITHDQKQNEKGSLFVTNKKCPRSCGWVFFSFFYADKTKNCVFAFTFLIFLARVHWPFQFYGSSMIPGGSSFMVIFSNHCWQMEQYMTSWKFKSHPIRLAEVVVLPGYREVLVSRSNGSWCMVPCILYCEGLGVSWCRAVPRNHWNISRNAALLESRTVLPSTEQNHKSMFSVPIDTAIRRQMSFWWSLIRHLV